MKPTLRITAVILSLLLAFPQSSLALRAGIESDELKQSIQAGLEGTSPASSNSRFRPQVEPLEDRNLPSDLAWNSPFFYFKPISDQKGAGTAYPLRSVIEINRLLEEIPVSQRPLVELYRRVLDRKPDPKGLKLLQVERERGTPLTALRRALADSPEAKRHLRDLLRAVWGKGSFGRGLGAQRRERAVVDRLSKRLGSGEDFEQIRERLAYGPRATKALLKIYQDLGRQPDPLEIDFFRKSLAQGVFVQDIRLWLASNPSTAIIRPGHGIVLLIGGEPAFVEQTRQAIEMLGQSPTFQSFLPALANRAIMIRQGILREPNYPTDRGAATFGRFYVEVAESGWKNIEYYSFDVIPHEFWHIYQNLLDSYGLESSGAPDRTRVEREAELFQARVAFDLKGRQEGSAPFPSAEFSVVSQTGTTLVLEKVTPDQRVTLKFRYLSSPPLPSERVSVTEEVFDLSLGRFISTTQKLFLANQGALTVLLESQTTPLGETFENVQFVTPGVEAYAQQFYFSAKLAGAEEKAADMEKGRLKQKELVDRARDKGPRLELIEPMLNLSEEGIGNVKYLAAKVLLDWISQIENPEWRFSMAFKADRLAEFLVQGVVKNRRTGLHDGWAQWLLGLSELAHYSEFRSAVENRKRTLQAHLETLSSHSKVTGYPNPEYEYVERFLKDLEETLKSRPVPKVSPRNLKREQIRYWMRFLGRQAQTHQREEAIAFLAGQGKVAVPILIQALRATAPPSGSGPYPGNVFKGIIDALGRIGPSAGTASPVLRHFALTQADPQLCEAAVRALGLIGARDSKTIADLREISARNSRSSSERVRETARSLLLQIEQTAGAEEAVEKAAENVTKKYRLSEDGTKIIRRYLMNEITEPVAVSDLLELGWSWKGRRQEVSENEVLEILRFADKLLAGAINPTEALTARPEALAVSGRPVSTTPAGIEITLPKRDLLRRRTPWGWIAAGSLLLGLSAATGITLYFRSKPAENLPALRPVPAQPGQPPVPVQPPVPARPAVPDPPAEAAEDKVNPVLFERGAFEFTPTRITAQLPRALAGRHASLFRSTDGKEGKRFVHGGSLVRVSPEGIVRFPAEKLDPWPEAVYLLAFFDGQENGLRPLRALTVDPRPEVTASVIRKYPGLVLLLRTEPVLPGEKKQDLSAIGGSALKNGRVELEPVRAGAEEKAADRAAVSAFFASRDVLSAVRLLPNGGDGADLADYFPGLSGSLRRLNGRQGKAWSMGYGELPSADLQVPALNVYVQREWYDAVVRQLNPALHPWIRIVDNVLQPNTLVIGDRGFLSRVEGRLALLKQTYLTLDAGTYDEVTGGLVTRLILRKRLSPGRILTLREFIGQEADAERLVGISA